MKRRSEGGLTLIELMIAVAILAMISTMVWSSFSQTTRAKKTIEASQDRYHETRIAMGRLARELSEAFLTKNFSTEGQLVTTPRSLFVSEDRPPFDRVDFVAFAHHRLYKDANESDQCEVSYFVTRDLEDPGVENLVRRESRRVDEDPRHGGSVLILVPDVAELDFSFFDTRSQEWVEYWDTTSLDGQPDRLPAFAKVVLVVKDGPDRTLRFVEKVTLQLENPIPEPRVRTLRVGSNQPGASTSKVLVPVGPQRIFGGLR